MLATAQRYHRCVTCLLLLMLSGCSATRQVDLPVLPDHQQLRLYPGDAPGEPTWSEAEPIPEMTIGPQGRYRYVHEPVLEVYHAKGAGRSDAAVVICPGGGYRLLAFEHEGVDVARWFSGRGITAVVLRYRVYPYRHPVPMMDVQRALQTVRANATRWGVDPQRIGVLGFSAGGHLASTAAIHHRPGNPSSSDPVERVSSRPDFAVLIYPVITMQSPHTHQGSRNNLLGPAPDASLLARMSTDKQVDPRTPPVLLVHSKDDKGVPIENSELFFAAMCKRSNSPSKQITFETGGHGYGLGRGDGHETDAWPDQCIDWLETIGVLASALSP